MATSEPTGTSLSTIDFSQEAVSKQVFKGVATSPLVVIPMAIGLVGLTAFLAGAALPPMLVYFLMGGGAVGGGWFALNLFGRRDALVARYLQQLNAATRDQSKVLAASLEEEFGELHFVRGNEQIKLL